MMSLEAILWFPNSVSNEAPPAVPQPKMDWEVGQERYGTLRKNGHTSVNGKEVEVSQMDDGKFMISIEGIPFMGKSFGSEADAMAFGYQEVMERYGK